MAEEKSRELPGSHILSSVLRTLVSSLRRISQILDLRCRISFFPGTRGGSQWVIKSFEKEWMPSSFCSAPIIECRLTVPGGPTSSRPPPNPPSSHCALIVRATPLYGFWIHARSLWSLIPLIPLCRIHIRSPLLQPPCDRGEGRAGGVWHHVSTTSGYLHATI